MILIDKKDLIIEGYQDILVLDIYKSEFLYILRALAKYIEFSDFFNKEVLLVKDESRIKSLEWFLKSFRIDFDRNKDFCHWNNYIITQFSIKLLAPEPSSLNLFNNVVEVFNLGGSKESFKYYEVFKMNFIFHKEEDINKFSFNNNIKLKSVNTYKSNLNDVLLPVDQIINKAGLPEEKITGINVDVLRYGQWARLFQSAIDYFIENQICNIEIIEDDHWVQSSVKLLEQLDKTNSKIKI